MWNSSGNADARKFLSSVCVRGVINNKLGISYDLLSTLMCDSDEETDKEGGVIKECHDNGCEKDERKRTDFVR